MIFGPLSSEAGGLSHTVLHFAMPKRVAVSVSLTPDLSTFMRQQVERGRYQSSSEVVREALRALQDRERLRSAVAKDLRRKIAEGLAAAEQGRVVDGDEAFAMLERRVKSRLRRAS